MLKNVVLFLVSEMENGCPPMNEKQTPTFHNLQARTSVGLVPLLTAAWLQYSSHGDHCSLNVPSVLPSLGGQLCSSSLIVASCNTSFHKAVSLFTF